MSTRNLLTTIDDVCKFAQRDIDFLKTMGITPELIETLVAKAQELQTNKPHAIIVGEKKMTTTARDLKLEEVKTLIEKLRKQLRLVFNSETNEFNSIFTKPLTKISVEQFITIADLTLKAINATTQNISIYGVTPEVVTGFDNKFNELVSLNNKQSSETKVIGSDTFMRSELKNEAYLLLEHIAAIGKEYWRKTNPERSKEYDIRKKRSSVATAPVADFAI